MEEEERRVGVIKEELGMLRAVLLPKMADNSIAGRKKRAAGKRMSDGINGNLPLCADISPALLGPLMVDQSSTTMEKVDLVFTIVAILVILHLQVEKELTWVGHGGGWAPRNCMQAQSVAFILPFR